MSQKFKITFSLATLPPAVKSLQVENLSRRTVQVSSDLRRLILKLSFRPSTTSPHVPCPSLTSSPDFSYEEKHDAIPVSPLLA